jgi:hypothetical protein
MNRDRKFYYVEPVEIEIYLKKAGKVRTVIRDLFIELIDIYPAPNEKSRAIFKHFKSLDEPIDLMELQNNFPDLIKIIYDSYYKNMDLFEKLSLHFKQGTAGSNDSLRLALYFTELLLKYEPTVAAKYIGDFQTYNLNYLIVKLNERNEKFLLEDSTVAYLIKRRNTAYQNKPRDREFDKLVELWEYNVKEKFI